MIDANSTPDKVSIPAGECSGTVWTVPAIDFMRALVKITRSSADLQTKRAAMLLLNKAQKIIDNNGS